MSRDRRIDDLTGKIARTAIGSVNLSAEDRMLAGTRVQRAIAVEAMGALNDVGWAAGGDKDDPRAEDFTAYRASNDRPHVAQDQARPEGAAARDLAAELLAADSRTNGMDEPTTEYAKDYIAHAVIVAAETEAKKLPSGPSQAPAAARGAAADPRAAAGAGGAGVAAGAAGAVAAPIAAAKVGVERPLQDRRPPQGTRGPSIG